MNYIPKYNYVILKLSKNVFPLSTPIPEMLFYLLYVIRFSPIRNHCRRTAIQATVRDRPTCTASLLLCVTSRFPLVCRQSTWLFVQVMTAFVPSTDIGVDDVEPPLADCAYALSFPRLVSSARTTSAEVWRRYSSVREREMRGPFRISFLFSSFLLLFSSSLRIF